MSEIIHKKKFPQGMFQVYDDCPDFPIHHYNQTHSCRILDYDKSLSALDTEADGIIIDPNISFQLPIAVKTADCLPVLLLGDKIALIHAGWKGLANGILNNRQLKQLNIHTAYIGPSIQKYEVQNDFRQYFPNNSNFRIQGEKLFFNLQNEAQYQCENYFKGIKVYNSMICTLDNTNYNSYRRNKTMKRNWNIFILNN